MAYSSLSSILDIVPGLPQTSTSAGYSVTALAVGKHITRADALINSKIAKRYAVPIVPTPPLLANLSEDITAYYTYRSFYSQDNLNKFDYFDELRSIALETLEGIRKGDIDLVDTSGSLIPEPSTTSLSMVDGTHYGVQPFFDVDDESQWKFDQNELDSIRDKR